MVQIFPKSAVAVDGEGRTPLHLACLSGWGFDEEVANVLCQAGPSALGTECRDGKTPMELIITSGSHVKLEVLDLLHSNTGRYLKAVRNGASCNTTNGRRVRGALHRAVSLKSRRSR